MEKEKEVHLKQKCEIQCGPRKELVKYIQKQVE